MTQQYEKSGHRFSQRGHHLSQLIYKKFGPERGAITAAADQLGVAPSNMSNMLAGRINTPSRHFTALEALPNYEHPLPPSNWPTINTDKSINAYLRFDTATVEKLIDLMTRKEKGAKGRRKDLQHDQIEEMVLAAVDYACYANRADIEFALSVASVYDEEAAAAPRVHRTKAQSDAALAHSIRPYDGTPQEDEADPDPLS